MPLQNTVLIPISVEPPPPGAEAAHEDFAFEEARPERELPIPRVAQREDAWCYAACSEMIINYSHGQQQVVDQCNVASFVKAPPGTAGCCGAGAPAVCTDRGCKLQDFPRIFDRFGLEFEPNIDTGTGDPDDLILGRITIGKMREELEADLLDPDDVARPVLVIVDWDDEDGSHALVVAGIDGQDIFIIDSLEDDEYGGWNDFDYLDSGFHEGEWVKTFPGLKRKGV